MSEEFISGYNHYNQVIERAASGNEPIRIDTAIT